MPMNVDLGQLPVHVREARRHLAWRELRPTLTPWRRDAFELGPLTRMVAVGLPIAVTMALEYGAFANTLSVNASSKPVPGTNLPGRLPGRR